jgi:hypothetical protein
MTNERDTSLALELKAAMDRETELFGDLGSALEKLQESLHARSWGTGLSTAQAVEMSAASIEKADAARDAAFVALRESLALPRATAFSAVLPFLPDGVRGELEASWRNLRASMVRLKTASGRARYAATTLADALNGILEQVFPYRKGKIYSRKGTPTSVGGAVLVDRRL